MRTKMVKLGLALCVAAMSFGGCQCSDDVDQTASGITGEQQLKIKDQMTKELQEIQKKKEEEAKKVLEK